ncbi:zinc finger CCCH domain-containing nuclear FMR1 interacting 1 family protein [Sporobolomyces salmoneus]|uniref:zinc finger CCCH domain-containing nuclear FMR1 interacting 1 family protein n=1 Tax=Sporobolomyces salmoneus TaxID=183962 RepID=UPI00317ECB34
MAYNPNRPPSGTHRSTPLIARPASNSHQNPVPSRPPPPGVPQGYLGNMLGGALAGMGYPSNQPGACNYPSQPFPPNPAYYPPAQQPYSSHQPQQQNGHYPQSYPPPPPQPYPSTSTSAYPPPPSFSSLPSRPSHSAFSPAPTPSSYSASSTPHPSRSAKPPPRTTEFACKLEGCPFVSKSRRTTREHEEDRHLIFEPGREPKLWSGSLKPLEGAVIEGTGISLDTPEAVAKWIADRKKRWPTKKLVDEKEKARDERIKAGLEEAPRERGAGRGRGRGRGGAMDSYGSRGRGRGGYGSNPQVRGREPDDRVEEPARKKLKTQDGVESSSGSSSGSDSDSDSDDSDEDEGPESISTVSKEALKALLGDEAEGDDDDDVDGEDDAVEEQSSKPPTNGDPASSAQNSTSTQKQFQVVCRHWRKGNCALGDAACPYLHTIPNDQPPPPPRRNRPHPRQAPRNPFSRPFQDAFQLLEEQDLKHVLSDLLQVVDFLKANDWLKGVELRPGQMDEESGIEVLDQSQEKSTEGGVEEVKEDKMKIEEVTKEEDLVQETTPAPPPPVVTVPKSGGLGLVADYASSDEEDEEAEEQVKQALLSTT